MNGYILVSLYWIGYFFLHSLLASEGVKSHFKNARGYRLFYSFLSVVLLLPIFYWLATTPSSYIFSKSVASDFLGFVAAAYGVIIIRLSFRQFGFREFIGLKSDAQEAFRANGILSKIRHPIYAGTILIVIGYVLYNPKSLNLLTAFWVFIYLPVGIRLEEKKLTKKYGQQYLDYKKTVPAIFPRWQALFQKSSPNSD